MAAAPATRTHQLQSTHSQHCCCEAAGVTSSPKQACTAAAPATRTRIVFHLYSSVVRSAAIRSACGTVCGSGQLVGCCTYKAVTAGTAVQLRVAVRNLYSLCSDGSCHAVEWSDGYTLGHWMAQWAILRVRWATLSETGSTL
jgi:hypothetical protein